MSFDREEAERSRERIQVIDSVTSMAIENATLWRRLHDLESVNVELQRRAEDAQGKLEEAEETIRKLRSRSRGSVRAKKAASSGKTATPRSSGKP